MQSRIKQVARIGGSSADRAHQAVKSASRASAQGRVVITLSEIVKRYGAHSVYDGLDLVLERGQKVASSAERAGRAPAQDPGRRSRVRGRDARARQQRRVAYFAQHQMRP